MGRVWTWVDTPARGVAAVLAVLAALACAAAVVFGISWYLAAHDDSLQRALARHEVLGEARQAAINLNTLDHEHVRQALDLWASAATGPLAAELATNRADYARAITESGISTDASVATAAVAELHTDSGTARVLVALDVTMNARVPPTADGQGPPQVAERRLELHLTRTEQGWKVGRIDAPGGSVAGPMPN